MVSRMSPLREPRPREPENQASPDELARDLESWAARGAILLDLTGRLNAATGVQDVADEATHCLREATQANFVGIAFADWPNGTMNYLNLSPLPKATVDEWKTFPIVRMSPPSDAARDARPIFFEDLEAAQVAYPPMREHFAAAGVQARAHLPLETFDGVLGTLTLTWPTPRQFGPVVRAFLTTATRHVALALQRALLYQAQEESLLHLQTAMLPLSLPQIPGVRVAAIYRPAETHVAVGGDWYDSVVLPGGQLALIVGDVTGHGLKAAVDMAGLRHTVRAFLMREDLPGEVLTHANRVLVMGDKVTHATVVVAVVDHERLTMTIAQAGHPPIVVLRPGAEPEVVECDRGPILGAVLGVAYASTTVQLEPGTTILLYTDGLVERRDEMIDVGIRRMARAACVVGDVALETLLEAVIEGCDDPHHSTVDDLCLLVARFDAAEV